VQEGSRGARVQPYRPEKGLRAWWVGGACSSEQTSPDRPGESWPNRVYPRGAFQREPPQRAVAEFRPSPKP